MYIDKISGKKIKRKNLIEKAAIITDAKFIADIQILIRDNVLRAKTGEPVFVADSQEFIEEIINSQRGIILMYFDDNQLVSFFELTCPNDSNELVEKYNLKKHLPNKDYKNMGVAETFVVLPQYRGNGLQVQMFKRMEELAISQGITSLIGTVHPENLYSYNNFNICGYKTISEIQYHNSRRHLKYKEIK